MGMEIAAEAKAKAGTKGQSSSGKDENRSAIRSAMMEKLEQMNPFEGFSKLERKERFRVLQDLGYLTKEDVKLLRQSSFLEPDLAEKFIENSIGYFPMPMGVATHFVIDGRPVLIPMAVEETSIIAAASKTAKWIKNSGEIKTQMLGHLGIGQIQIAILKSPEDFEEKFKNIKKHLVELANKIPAKGLVERGGGVKDVKLRLIPRPDGYTMAVIHVEISTCDAMGANIINQVCEFLSSPIEDLTDESVSVKILSNLTDTRLVRAEVTVDNIDPDLAIKIQETSLFAQLDPYRASTNNKGVLNGIDPILMATGNDWRAVEAGVHAYATMEDGQYRSITKWKASANAKSLTGELIAPISVGTVGGVTKLHPFATMAIKMMNIQSADDLSRVCAAVGLVQNLGALRALSTVGIIEGHMKLHIKNLALSAGAKESETHFVQKKLEEILQATKRISLSHAIDVLNELRTRDLGEESKAK